MNESDFNIVCTRLPMEMDTGVAVSIISDDTHKEMFPALKLYNSNILPITYTEELIPLFFLFFIFIFYLKKKFFFNIHVQVK